MQEGVRTGWDDGALGFEEDAVWFSGRACSFRIAAADLLPPSGLRANVGIPDGRTLALRHPTRRIWIDVAPIAQGGFRDWESSQAIADEIVRLRQRRESTTASQYPPLVPRPGLVRPLPSQRLRLVVWVALLVTTIVALFFQAFFVPAFLGMVYATGVFPSAWSGGFRREELDRIAREEEG